MTKTSKKPTDRTLAAHYERLVVEQKILSDDAQRRILAELEMLSEQLTKPKKLFAKKAVNLRGIYMWGNVGRGKSMLMDLFFEHTAVAKKRRVHFHAFMQDVHARIHELRREGKGDPVALLAQELATETTLLCFDELQATDVADATLLYRLFSGLFDAGVTIVSTSNHPPASLYTGGVQRERFAKFIALIEEHMHVLALSSPDDYRHMQTKSLKQVYFYPLGPAADAFVEQAIGQLADNPAPQQATLSVHGRTTHFMLYDNAIGQFSFHQLCETAMGPADYLALAKRLETLILTGIPELASEKRNEAKRFVTLVDTLYERKVMLIATAAAPPERIYAKGDGSFEFHRTVSRLAEMQSTKYLKFK